VSVHREKGARLRRDDARALLAGTHRAGDRILADEPEVPAVSYTRNAPAGAAIAEHLRFSLGNAPPGRHVVEVKIEDLVARKTVARSVMVRVLEPGAQRREGR
jgi:hypothetical protein